VFHGAGDTAEGTAQSTDFESVADKYGEVVAFLQGYDDTWNEGAGHTPAERAHLNDVQFTADVIAKIETLLSFDRHRIAAAGFSNGALMVQYLGCKLASKLALIVPVEGELPVSVAASCAPKDYLSVYEIHGTADSTIPYGGGPFAGEGGGTTVLSAPASVAKWAKLDHCATKPTTTYPTAGIKLTSYTRCRGGVTVTLRTIIGGTHEWGAAIGVLVTEAIGD
jgi:polyhydroxybutyrate depolymerase